MSNWGIEDANDLGGNNDNTGPKALRDAYDALKQQNKELQDGLAAVQTQLRNQTVGAALSELGIPAAAAEQYKGEADPAKVREWAASMQTLFGGGQAVTPGSTPTPTDQQQAPEGLAPDLQQQMQRMTEAGQQGAPLGNTEAAAARIGDATDIAGLISAWQTMK
uniref:Scaffolding protein n=1 Tax=Streptomyces phage Abafar TaxID=3158855 RepID=A0AAU7GWX8_9CAUD